MKKGKDIVLLIMVVIVLIALNYSFLDSFVVKSFGNEKSIHIERVIDGDTVVDTEGIHYRLLGINTPEKGEKYSNEAKEFTSGFVLNKTVLVESRGKDLYGRELGYLFDEYGNNINLEVVREGYANAYFPEGKDKYYAEFMQAWRECAEIGRVNLCERSLDKCAECIKVVQFGYDEDLIIENSCGFKCDLSGWSVKDEGRKKFIFENGTILNEGEDTSVSAEDFNKTYVWTRTGDTMFLRDFNGDLVLWEGY